MLAAGSLPLLLLPQAQGHLGDELAIELRREHVRLELEFVVLALLALRLRHLLHLAVPGHLQRGVVRDGEVGPVP